MDLSDADTWRWIWLVAAAVLAVGEIAMPGTFFLVSFAIGAAIAALVAFLGGEVWLQWLCFVGLSGAAVAVLYPIGRRIDARHQPAAVGANRFGAKRATVLAAIPAGLHETGLVRIEREEWRAESSDGSAVPAGTVVGVVEVRGTRVVVDPTPIATTPRPEVPQEGHEAQDVRRSGPPGPSTSAG